jgi:hypothetical protein
VNPSSVATVAALLATLAIAACTTYPPQPKPLFECKAADGSCDPPGPEQLSPPASEQKPS